MSVCSSQLHFFDYLVSYLFSSLCHQVSNIRLFYLKNRQCNWRCSCKGTGLTSRRDACIAAARWRSNALFVTTWILLTCSGVGKTPASHVAYVDMYRVHSHKIIHALHTVSVMCVCVCLCRGSVFLYNIYVYIYIVERNTFNVTRKQKSINITTPLYHLPLSYAYNARHVSQLNLSSLSSRRIRVRVERISCRARTELYFRVE